MDAESVVIGFLLVLNGVQAVQMVLMGRQRVRELQDARDQVDRILVLQRAETLDQFAAVDERMRKERLESLRHAYVPPQPAEPREVAQSRPSVLSQLWRRPRRDVTRVAEPKE